MTGIEPAYLAWEASTLPLSYIRISFLYYYITLFEKNNPKLKKILYFILKICYYIL